jgi:hypothetical protein
METKKITPEHIKQAGVLLKQEHDERVRLEKVASAFEKKAQAEKLAFREVELGISEPFKNYEEYQEKVANLLKEDLAVVEKALERGYGSAPRAGELVGETSNKVTNPFEHFVRTGELVAE